MSRLITDLDPDIQALCLEHVKLCAAEGIICIVTQTYRTAAEQQALYDRGRVSPGLIVTHAPPGHSFHEYRRAYDLAIKSFAGDKTPHDLYDGPWHIVGELGERAGLEWGGRWKHPDMPHFEHWGGKTLAEWRAAGPR